MIMGVSLFGIVQFICEQFSVYGTTFVTIRHTWSHMIVMDILQN